MNGLIIKNLTVSVNEKVILDNINFKIKGTEVHAIMGPNGSGKSTLCYAIMGNPKYKIEKGKIIFNGKDITNSKPEERAKAGLFLSFQNPVGIQGISMMDFMWITYNQTKKKKISLKEFTNKFDDNLKKVNMKKEFGTRYINDGFSGGEKKLSEILQMNLLNPKIAILDEADSGLDIDSLKLISNNINNQKKSTGIILITHYQKILQYVKPDFIHIMKNGRIVKSGGYEVIKEIEKKGYKLF